MRTRDSNRTFLLPLLFLLVTAKATATLILPPYVGDDVHISFGSYDTTGRHGVFYYPPLELAEELEAFTLDPDPPYYKSSPFALISDPDSMLEPGTPFVIKADFLNYGCLLGVGNAGVFYLDGVSGRPTTQGVIIIPIDPNSEGLYLNPINFNRNSLAGAYSTPDSFAISASFLLKDSLDTPGYAVGDAVLPVEYRDRPVTVSVWVGEGATSPTLVHTYDWKLSNNELHSPNFIFGEWYHDFPPPEPPGAFLVEPGGGFPTEEGVDFYISDTFTSGTVRLKFSIPGYHEAEVENSFETGWVYFPTLVLAPDDSPEAGPRIGEFRTSEPIRELLLNSSLLDSCNNFISFDPDRNKDGIRDAADSIAPPPER